MNLIDLLSQDGLTVRKVASTQGGEYAGPCPFCQGKDRFRVWPESDRSGRWWCRQCERYGDGIQYLRDKRGLGYHEALLALGMEPDFKPRFVRPVKDAWRPRITMMPSDAWMLNAGLIVADEAMTLNAEALAWLNGRGITEDMARADGLVWNSRDWHIDRKVWGLDGDKPLWIPAGLVIPCVLDGKVIRLRIRRREGNPRYVIVSGSDTRPMILGRGVAVIVVESELDAILIDRLAGDLVRVVALGNAQAKPDEAAHQILVQSPVILNSLDGDEAGASQAWGWWRETYGAKVRRWPVPVGKDPGEAYQRGLSIRSWILAGILGTEDQEERFAIMKYDGEVSEAGAVRYILTGEIHG